eukprot:TRINITY_DN16058_c0_g1_i1.p1 TRINITY_DN16058_c0_g1~~TRINITY_DN16058_c0_g1_i1.p1  ORF type:complete len:1015 (-),score=184.28 TRINITY_DN16058_c0_g1_i1:295-3339(-)
MLQKLSPGDWICSDCGDHQFARNHVCRKCGTPRCASAPPEPAMPPKPAQQEAALKLPKPAFASARTIYPSVYISDLPVEYAQEERVREFCSEGFISVKFLDRKFGDDSCCCIVRYSDDDCAQQAIDIIHGMEVTVANGNLKHLAAKFAQPAAWMEEKRNHETLTDGRRNFDERTIWIGQMPNSVSSKFDVAQALEIKFGEVIHVHLQQDLSHGFVHFASEESAAAAIWEESFSLHGKLVEIRKAQEKNPKRKELLGIFEEEAAICWEGRFESFKKGHGFLRPIESTASLQLSESIPPGLETGVYVSKAQAERFGLRDTDIVTAIVRQPRQSNNRFLGKYTSGKDEKSWALMRVMKVNGRASEDHDRGCSGIRLRDNIDLDADCKDGRKHDERSFEWTGVVELFRKGHHAYLRPLPDDNKEASGNDELVDAWGVYVPAQLVSTSCLHEGMIVRALCDPPYGNEKSPSVIKVLEILGRDSCGNDQAGGEVLYFEGVFEAFKKGFGFVRPLKGAEDDLDPRLLAGAFVTQSQVDRFDLRDGQRVTALVRPGSSDGVGPRSAYVTDVLNASLEGHVGGDGELWSLLGLGSATGSSKVVEADMDELPEEQLALKGKKLHGVVIKLKGTHQLQYGFIKADHTDIKQHLFFHPVDIKFPSRAREQQFWPRIGESVFFCVATRRVSNKVLLSAARLNFPSAKITRQHQDKDAVYQGHAVSAAAADWPEETDSHQSDAHAHREHSADTHAADGGYPSQDQLPPPPLPPPPPVPHPPSGPPPMHKISSATYPHPPGDPPPMYPLQPPSLPAPAPRPSCRTPRPTPSQMRPPLENWNLAPGAAAVDDTSCLRAGDMHEHVNHFGTQESHPCGDIIEHNEQELEEDTSAQNSDLKYVDPHGNDLPDDTLDVHETVLDDGLDGDEEFEYAEETNIAQEENALDRDQEFENAEESSIAQDSPKKSLRLQPTCKALPQRQRAAPKEGRSKASQGERRNEAKPDSTGHWLWSVSPTLRQAQARSLRGRSF